MILHLINKAPSHSAWQDMQNAITEHGSIVLMDDAVYALRDINALALDAKTLYAIDDDIKMRGLSATEGIKVISMAELVALTLTAQHCLSWF